jgi:homoserine O-succinyltransferase/O-acetyltransferase
MSWNDKKLIRIAILDLYAGQANQGMRCIREIINQWSSQHNLDMEYDEFDVRLKNEVPDTTYDIYISSGGPGDPWEKPENKWDETYFDWINSMLKFNNDPANQQKKFVFFICHSFQLAARHFNIGKVCKRNSTAFGVFPIHMLNAAYEEIVFQGLKDPFYSVDSRDYQVIEPNYDALEKIGATLLCIEKSRPHVPYERALMGVRFNEFMIGTQFHPEADAIGMSMYLQTEEKKKTVIDNHGEAKWSSMIEHLNDPDKIMWTYNHILPNFLNQAVGQLQEATA